MELYRVLTKTPATPICASDKYLNALYRAACCPAVPKSKDDLDVTALAKLEAKFFFPATAVQKFVTSDLLEDITKCKCESCKSFQGTNGLSGPERGNLVETILNNRAKAAPIVANLIYLQETGRLYHISTLPAGLAKGIDSVAAEESLRQKYPIFASNFSRTKLLFQPPTLLAGDTECNFEPGTRLPFLDEEECGRGSFGVVTKFKIHPDYIDERVRLIAVKYITRSQQAPHDKQELFFARKTIQGARDQSYKNEVQLERDVLGVIARQSEEHKMNIMDLIAFYSFGDELNLVFPYVPGSLEKYLEGTWYPEHIRHNEHFPEDWITSGLIGLAKGLQVIHHPPYQLTNEYKILGYHFDLKPANILITSAGVFKITDFGQSLITVVQLGESTSGNVAHDGGDPVYAPPEDMPTREQVKRSSQSHKYGVDITRAPQPIPDLATDQRDKSAAQLLSIPASNARSHASSRLSIRSGPAMGSAQYDIWSLACVMLLVFTHTRLGEATAVRQFRQNLKEEWPEIGYHTGYRSLKHSVKEQLRVLKGGQAPLMSSMQDFMEGVVSLMERMFALEVGERPAAIEVANELELICWKYKNSPNDPDGLLAAIRGRDCPGSANDYFEVASDNVHTSFMYMDGIKVGDASGGFGFEDCRIKIFALKPNHTDGSRAELMVIIARLQDGEIKFQEWPIILREARFYPLYLFTEGVESRQDCCKLTTNGSENRFWFESNLEGLLAFQAVFFQHVVEPGRAIFEPESILDDSNAFYSVATPSKVSMKFKIEGTEFVATPRAMQIWTARKRNNVSMARSTTTLSTSSSGQDSTGARLIIFLKSCRGPKTKKRYDVLQVPLESYIGEIVEGDRNGGSTTSLTFLPKTPNSDKSIFKAVLSEFSNVGGDATTSLSLNPQKYGVQDAPLEGEKAFKVKIHFQDHAAISTIRPYFDRANMKNRPKIRWSEGGPTLATN